MSYATYQPLAAPAWLQGPNGTAWETCFGASKDEVVARLKLAIKSKLPDFAPTDALAAIGYERSIARGQGDTDPQYAGRLLDAWETWSRAGTPLGLLLAIEVLYPSIPVAIVQQAGWAFTLDTNTALDPLDRLILTQLGDIRGEPGWWFDNNSGLPPDEGFWSRFGVIFYDPSNLPAGWAAGAVSPPTSVSTPTLAQVNSLIATVIQWKAAKSTCVWIEVVMAGEVWGYPPTMSWGDPGLVWGGGSVVRWNGQTLYV